MAAEAEQGHRGEKEAEELLNRMGMAVEVEVALSHTVMEEQEVVAEEPSRSAPAGEDEPSRFLP